MRSSRVSPTGVPATWLSTIATARPVSGSPHAPDPPNPKWPNPLGEDSGRRPGEVIPEPPAHRKPDHGVASAYLNRCGLAHRCRRYERRVVEGVGCRESGVHAGEVAGSEHSVGGGDLTIVNPMAAEHLDHVVDDKCLDEWTEPIEAPEPFDHAVEAAFRLLVEQQVGGECPTLWWQADGHTLESERFDNFALDRFVDGETGDPTDHLADKPTEREGVIARTCPGFPDGLGSREDRDHRIPVEHGLRR